MIYIVIFIFFYLIAYVIIKVIFLRDVIDVVEPAVLLSHPRLGEIWFAWARGSRSPERTLLAWARQRAGLMLLLNGSLMCGLFVWSKCFTRRFAWWWYD